MLPHIWSRASLLLRVTMRPTSNVCLPVYTEQESAATSDEGFADWAANVEQNPMPVKYTVSPLSVLAQAIGDAVAPPPRPPPPLPPPPPPFSPAVDMLPIILPSPAPPPLSNKSFATNMLGNVSSIAAASVGPTAQLFNFDVSHLPSGWATGGGTPATYPFKARSGATGTGSTGPQADHTTGSGTYYYAETSSPRVAGDVFTLTYDGSACLNAALRVETVTFWYHMYGSTQGTLTFEDADGSVLWELSGNQGDQWRSANDIAVDSTSFSFRYVQAEGIKGDVAIDDVSVMCGMKSPPPSPPLPSPPPSAQPSGSGGIASTPVQTTIGIGEFSALLHPPPPPLAPKTAAEFDFSANCHRGVASGGYQAHVTAVSVDFSNIYPALRACWEAVWHTFPSKTNPDEFADGFLLGVGCEPDCTKQNQTHARYDTPANVGQCYALFEMDGYSQKQLQDSDWVYCQAPRTTGQGGLTLAYEIMPPPPPPRPPPPPPPSPPPPPISVRGEMWIEAYTEYSPKFLTQATQEPFFYASANGKNPP